MKNTSSSNLLIGKKLIRLDKVASTNQYASDLMKYSDLEEGTVIITNNQYEGRGQRTKKWESEPYKNITVSIILKPAFLKADHAFYLNKAITLGIYDFILSQIASTDSLQVKVKWPNDIYFCDKKIAGILIENVVSTGYLKTAIIGIGININQISFSDDCPNAVSLNQIVKKELDLDWCILKLCNVMETRYMQLKDQHFKQIDSQYVNALYLLGTLHQYKVQDKIIHGIIKGATSHGKLILNVNNVDQYFDFQEIIFQ